jgi:hypothetical protein
LTAVALGTAGISPTLGLHIINHYVSRADIW